MATVEVKIEGADQIIKSFRRSPKLFTDIFNKAIKKSILVLLGETRQVTPVDTGFLRETGMQTSFAALIGQIDNIAPYATYVHEGTKLMEARPFFEWGAESGKDQVDAIFDAAMTEFKNNL